MFAITAGGGSLMSPADVCKTPIGPAQVPIPYPNIVSPAQGAPVSTKVFICGSPAVNKNTTFSPSNGDQAGATGGVASNVIMGPVKFNAGSVKIMIDGIPAVRLSMPTSHNDNNAVGLAAAPSQTKVIIKS